MAANVLYYVISHGWSSSLSTGRGGEGRGGLNTCRSEKKLGGIKMLHRTFDVD